MARVGEGRQMTFQGVPATTPDPETVRTAVATITARDPAFNLDAFLAEAQQGFWLVGRAHAECKPELCQSVLSAALAAREQAAIEQACRVGKPTAPMDEDASTGQLVSIDADANTDTAVVHFVSTWRPVSNGKGKGDRRVQNWCFQRQSSERTVKTQEGQHCQNCGAMLSGSTGTCRYCGANIGTGSGWQVIRIDEVGAQEAAQAAAAMRSIMGQVLAARGSYQPLPPQPVRTGPARRSRSGCFPVFLFILLVIAGLGIDAAGGNGTFHRDVAKALPTLRHPRLTGPLDLTGQLIAQRLSATQVPPRFQFRGTCAKEAIRTAWTFTAKLPDGSKFELQIGLPPGQGGPGTYQRPKVSVSANAQNASRFTSWTTAAGTAALAVRSDGGGDLQFASLPAGQSGGSPLSGHLAWSCTLD
jgi:hypothetical protein